MEACGVNCGCGKDMMCYVSVTELYERCEAILIRVNDGR